jgi:hypothetical protein
VVLLLAGFSFAGGIYLLLIDTTSLPELYTGAAITLLAVLAIAAAREQGFAEASIAARWLLRAWRPVARVPLDVALVSLAALAQLVRPSRRRGRFVAIPFATEEAAGSGERAHARNTGRRALAEMLGSLAPNTIVLGVDTSRRLILAHQLSPRVERASIDPMDLG